MDDLTAAHLVWLEAQHDRAPSTIASRRRVLRSIPNAGTADRADVDHWWTDRAHLADGTRVVDLSHLREFYNWCQIYQHRADDPSVHLRSPKLGNVMHDDNLVSNADLDRLVLVLPPPLARAVRLGAGAGLRVSESAALEWSDINTADDTIRVTRSKRKKTRVVPVSPELIHHLARGTDQTGSVVTGGGPCPDPALFQKRLNRAMRAAGAEFTSHDLRHRYGIKAYRKSQDLLAVGEMMGHSNINTTKIYASADSEVKRKIAAAVMW